MTLTKPEELIGIINKLVDFDIRKKSRKRKIVYSRYIFFLKIHALNDPKDKSIYTLRKIADYLNMDHAIVSHAIKEYPKLCNYSDFKTLEIEINEAIKDNNKFLSNGLEKLNDCFFEIRGMNKKAKNQKTILRNEKRN
jgi:hypothetical protein